MAATAKLIKRGFSPSAGLDRRFCHELWHVIGIEEGTWKRSSTSQAVFPALGFAQGSPHPDSGLAGAVCTMIALVDGPWIQSDGTMEAVVSATFDSDRRWGGAFYESAYTTGEDYDNFIVPNWAKGVEFPGPTPGGQPIFEWIETETRYSRSRIIRVEFRSASGITVPERANLFTYVGQAFLLDNVPFLYRTPTISVTRTNQTIIRYTFESSSKVMAFPANATTGFGVPVPQLDELEEYVRVYPTTSGLAPSIGKRPVLSSYAISGLYLNPVTTLPYWGQRLTP